MSLETALMGLFLDADKEQVPEYYEWARKLTGPGALIIIDNVVRDGRLTHRDTEERLAAHRHEAARIQRGG